MSPKLTKFRELNPGEVALEVVQNEFKIFISCYWLVLETKNEVSEGQIKEALRILYRNIDVLRICIRKENGRYFFYEIDEEKIPLQAFKNQTPSEVFSNETHRNFDTAEGPLYRATYITNDKTAKSKNFTSNILFAFHHVVIDGFTALNICNSFLTVLNDVIGENIQKFYDFGQLNDGHETEELEELGVKYLNINSENFTEINKDDSKLNNLNLLLDKIFSLPKSVEMETKYIHGEIDKETNTKLTNVFKSNGITYHAGFCSVFNWVIMDIFTEKGLGEKNVELRSEHVINLRRYWKKYSSVQLGSHVAVIKILSKTNKNIGENFWEYAKQLNNALKSAIKNMDGVDIVQYLKNAIEVPEMDFSKRFENSSSSIPYYCATNMGDISSIVQGQRDHVSLRWLSRGASGQYVNKLLIPFIQTFEGRLLYCMAYSPRYLTDDFANLCVEKIIKKLMLLSNSQ